jgi:hypothetical protein
VTKLKGKDEWPLQKQAIKFPFFGRTKEKAESPSPHALMKGMAMIFLNRDADEDEARSDGILPRKEALLSFWSHAL